MKLLLLPLLLIMMMTTMMMMTMMMTPPELLLQPLLAAAQMQRLSRTAAGSFRFAVGGLHIATWCVCCGKYTLDNHLFFIDDFGAVLGCSIALQLACILAQEQIRRFAEAGVTRIVESRGCRKDGEPLTQTQ